MAYGVNFWHDGREKVAKAHGEVILSAGAIASPQILMLSGIGPSSHLAEHKIPVWVDLPVGLNMQSHVGVGEVLFTVQDQVTRHFTFLQIEERVKQAASFHLLHLCFSELTFRISMDLSIAGLWPTFLFNLKRNQSVIILTLINVKCYREILYLSLQH